MTCHRLTIALAAVVIAGWIAFPLQAADAASLYKSKCFACHGEKGNGQTTMGKKLAVRALGAAAVQAQSDAALLAILTKGQKKMPAFGGKIPDADLKLLVTLLRTFAAK
jgi:mono/diheme cytochrome c family protein